MKYIISLFAVSIFLFLSFVSFYIEDSNSFRINSSSEDAYIIKDNKAFFYDKSVHLIHFIEFKSRPVQLTNNFIKVNDYDKKSNLISISYEEGDIVYSISDNIYGIGSIGNPELINRLITQENGETTFSTSEIDENNFCTCISYESDHEEKCVSGGQGAISASVGGTKLPFLSENKPNLGPYYSTIKCMKEKYYPCCNYSSKD